jgi:hypothetical protein
LRAAVKAQVSLAIAIVIGLGPSANAITWTTLDDPLGTNGTYAYGISSSSVVGYYQDSSDKYHGFLYDGSTYTTIDFPSASSTWAYGISGSTIVGEFRDSSGGYHGFVTYPGGSGPYFVTMFKGLNAPSGVSGQTYAWGIDGGNVVGYCQNKFGIYWYSGFLYNGSAWTTLNDPLVAPGFSTCPQAVSGNNVVGCYETPNGWHGFLYDGSSYSTLDDPSAGYGTWLYGISDSNSVGMYADSVGSHGCLYDGSIWTTLDDPSGARGTYAYGVSGNSVVGAYQDSSGYYHGFIADVSVPEPSAFALLGAGAVALFAYFLRRQRSK